MGDTAFLIGKELKEAQDRIRKLEAERDAVLFVLDPHANPSLVSLVDVAKDYHEMTMEAMSERDTLEAKVEELERDLAVAERTLENMFKAMRYHVNVGTVEEWRTVAQLDIDDEAKAEARREIEEEDPAVALVEGWIEEDAELPVCPWCKGTKKYDRHLSGFHGDHFGGNVDQKFVEEPCPVCVKKEKGDE